MRLEVTLSYRIDLGTVLYSLKVLVRIDESCIGMRVSQNKILPKVISIEHEDPFVSPKVGVPEAAKFLAQAIEIVAKASV